MSRAPLKGKVTGHRYLPPHAPYPLPIPSYPPSTLAPRLCHRDRRVSVCGLGSWRLALRDRKYVIVSHTDMLLCVSEPRIAAMAQMFAIRPDRSSQRINKQSRYRLAFLPRAHPQLGLNCAQYCKHLTVPIVTKFTFSPPLYLPASPPGRKGI